MYSIQPRPPSQLLESDVPSNEEEEKISVSERIETEKKELNFDLIHKVKVINDYNLYNGVT
jgi:hypothetical protein